MSSSSFATGSLRERLQSILLVALALPATAAAAGDFVIGAGVETDSQDSIAFSLLGDVAVGESTWLSASVGYSGVDAPVREEVDYLYVDVGIDHFFDPVGIRFGVSYWGDSDLLDSNDLRGSIYSRGEGRMLSFDAEHRQFTFDIPALDAQPRADVEFDATGAGLSARFDVSDSVSFSASGMSYEYSREFNLGDDAARVVDLLTFSRLSVLSSLVDWRARAGLDFDFGLQSLQLSLSKWRGVVDKSSNVGATIGFLTPVGNRADLEISLGYDDSNLYGDVTFLSVFIYLYGGD